MAPAMRETSTTSHVDTGSRMSACPIIRTNRRQNAVGAAQARPSAARPIVVTAGGARVELVDAAGTGARIRTSSNNLQGASVNGGGGVSYRVQSNGGFSGPITRSGGGAGRPENPCLARFFSGESDPPTSDIPIESVFQDVLQVHRSHGGDSAVGDASH